jgi:pimeloyl-ACP methyl ester carboxylesterase
MPQLLTQRVFVFCLILLSVIAQAQSQVDQAFQGFVKISPERELFVDMLPAKSGQPTVILVNGLTYSTKQWEDYAQELNSRYGVGILRYDMIGMGETLLKYAPVTKMISWQDQVKDLRALIRKLKISSPVHLVGLSYGGGIAIAFAAEYPKLVRSVIAMAPFTEPVEDQDRWIRTQVTYTRLMNPWNPYTDEEIYDYYLRQLVYATYPYAEPILLENPYKLEATFRMVQGIRHWNSSQSVEGLPAKSLHLVIAGSDQYIKRLVLDRFWLSVPEKSRGSKTILQGVGHKIPEAAPRQAADLTAQILGLKKTRR